MDSPMPIAKFTSKQSSAGCNYEQPSTTEHVRRHLRSEHKIAQKLLSTKATKLFGTHAKKYNEEYAESMDFSVRSACSYN